MTNVTSSVTLAVDSTQVSKATAALGGMAAAGTSASASAEALKRGSKGASDALAETATAAKAAEGALRAKAKAEQQAADEADKAAKRQASTAARALAEAERAAQKQRNIGAQQTTQLGFQLQDFFVQIQAGQNPLTAFIQQGSQLSGVYGGAGNAFRAVTGLLTPLRLAFGGVAAVIGAAVIATEQAAGEQKAYSAAIEGTNGAVGKTRGQLQDYAREIAKTAGTTGAAADAIAQLAATGRVTGSSLLDAGLVAVRAQRLIGREVAETVKAYASLGKDPVNALLQLNEGTNFLTAALYRQVLAFKSVGNDSAAAALAQTAYSAAQKRVLDDAQANLSPLEKAFKAAKNGAADFWDAVVGLGRPESLAQQIEKASKALEKAPRRGGNAVENDKRRGGIADNRENLSRQFLAQDNASAGAAAALKEQQDALEELSASRQAARAGKDKAAAGVQLASALASIEQRRNATLLAFQRDEVDADEHQRNLLAIDRASISAQIANIDRVTAIEAARRTSSVEDKLAQETTLLALGQQRIAQAQRLSDLAAQEARGLRDVAPKSRSLGGRDALNAFKSADEANVSAFFKAEKEGALAAALALKEAQAAAQAYLDTFTLGQARELQGLTMGSAERSREQARQQIRDRYEQQRLQLEAQRRSGQIDKQRYDAELQVLEEFKGKALASYEDYVLKRLALEGEFSTGASRALADYLESGKNVAALSETAFTNAFKGAEDALVQFVTTGKTSVKGLVQSVIADLARIQIRQGLSQLLGFFAGGPAEGVSTNNTGGQLPTAGGRAIGGPVSRGSIYQVAEKGQPELLTSGGKSYLMTGAQGGQVTPATASEAAPVININVAGDATPQTVRLIAAQVQQAIARERRQRAYAGA